jgi:hypothetical protein
VRSGASRTRQAPTELDVYAPERWVDDALFRPEVREAYRRLVAQGWVDALRALHPGERVYTFWKYLRNAFERDAGLRNRPSSSKTATAIGVFLLHFQLLTAFRANSPWQSNAVQDKGIQNNAATF